MVYSGQRDKKRNFRKIKIFKIFAQTYEGGRKKTISNMGLREKNIESPDYNFIPLPKLISGYAFDG